MKQQLDEINNEIIDFMAAHEKTNAEELSKLIGITVPSIRYRIFQLMAKGIVRQEKTRDHHVWFFLKNQSEFEDKNDDKSKFTEFRS